LSPSALREIPTLELAQLIHPVGYYHAKAFKLQALVRWLRASCGDNLDRLFTLETADLRQQLLAVHGIGPETPILSCFTPVINRYLLLMPTPVVFSAGSG
jgi:endonuclease-3 related protein